MAMNSTMDEFCGSTFWNTSLTWNTDNPDFTPCFQKTVLIWVPCGYLWLAAIMEVYQMVISKESNIPRNKLNNTKLIITFLLILLQIIDIGQVIYVSSRKQYKVFDADYYNPVVKLLTFMMKKRRRKKLKLVEMTSHIQIQSEEEYEKPVERKQILNEDDDERFERP